MGYQARWGPKGFIVSASKIVGLEELSTSLTLKEDSENDTSGTQPTNTRGRELRPITLKTTYLAAAGVNPRSQIEEWEKELGNAYPLIIGGKRFGGEKMKLKKVSSDIQLTNSGAFIKATVSLEFEEYSEGKKSKLVSNSPGGGSAGGADPKKEALNTTASASDRAAKKAPGVRGYTM